MPFDLIILGEIAHGSIKHGIAAYELWKQHQIADTVEKIAAKLKKADRRTLRRAYQHLEHAANAGTDKSRDAELDHARAAFADICALEPEPDNDLLIALGHYGSFCYFTAIDDFANAIHHVYTCTGLYPDVAVQMFPPEFFSKNYRDQIAQAGAKLDLLRARHTSRELEQMRQIQAEVRNQIQTAMRGGGLMEIPRVNEAAVQAAMEITRLEGEVRRAAGELEQLRKGLAAECAEWRKYLKRKQGAALKVEEFLKRLARQDVATPD